jgi:hypothetical protein
MRNLVYAAAFGAVLMASPAMAAVDLGFTGISNSAIDWQDSRGASQGATFPNDGVIVSAAKVPAKNGGGTANYGGSTQAQVDISNNGKKASFTSGVAARGVTPSGENPYGAYATSTTGIDAVITNNGSGPVTLNSIGSTIIQAGMGFMIQNPTGSAIGNNVFTGYGADPLGALSDFSKKNTTIATSSFNFDVFGADYLTNSEAEPLYTLSGSVSLGFDQHGNVVLTSDVADAKHTLKDFTKVVETNAVDGESHPLNDAYLLGYQWDETNIDVILDQLLGAGDTTQLFYRATSTVDISAPCVSATECLVAYSGFGDPVGRGGGVEDFAFDSFDQQGPSTGSTPCPDNDSQICFSPQSVKPFGRLDVTDSSVPEPASWMTMILGFGLLGGALRRRGVVSYS